MLSLVQNLVPPAGVYSLGTHRATVKRKQIESIIYALRILNRFISPSVRVAPMYIIQCVYQLKIKHLNKIVSALHPGRPAV